ncbi:MAG: hypothetical protein HYV37_02900 [Candidatus Levyibacteriota bacterium]|nr:MAG: hypothetical protein HYV37_02900 [Candidatus Levybacteria bacterium]
MQPAFYDPNISFDENFAKGPPILSQNITPPQRDIKKTYKFLGFNINLPFGIPAGPLLNSQFIKTAFEWGFDVSCYKTVRAAFFPSHPFPNVVSVDIKGDLHPEKLRQVVIKNIGKEKAVKNITITNSFGVPSQNPNIWQPDAHKAVAYAKKGQLMILSFMGTVKENQTQEDFIKDFALTAKLANDTGAKALEANLSCPNIGNEGLVCYSLDVTQKVCEAIREAIGNTPLILKVGHYKLDKDIEVLAEIANEYAQAISAINTLQVEVVDQQGKQALPGKNRLRSGVGGAGIKWAGLEMTRKLNTIRQKNGYKYEIVGVGGVMNPNDYLEYRKAGADVVQSATAAMWNPYLAHEIFKGLSL